MLTSQRLTSARAGALASVLLLAPLPPAVLAESRLYFEPQEVPAGDPAASVAVSLDADEAVYGFQLSLESEAGLTFLGVSLEGTVAESADWSGGSVLDDGNRLTWGVVLNLRDPLSIDKFIPAGEGHRLAHLEVEVTATERSTSTLRFSDFPGVPAARNKLVTARGEALPVTTLPGAIEIKESFIRGDSNGDLSVDISDGVWTLNFLFLGGGPPPCMDAADANDGGEVDLADAVYTFNFLFTDGSRPPPPFPGPGLDPTEDSVPCGDDVPEAER